MSKLFSKIATAFVGMAMAIGVGVAIGANQDVKVARATTGATISGYAQATSIDDITNNINSTFLIGAVVGETTYLMPNNATNSGTISGETTTNIGENISGYGFSFAALSIDENNGYSIRAASKYYGGANSSSISTANTAGNNNYLMTFSLLDNQSYGTFGITCASYTTRTFSFRASTYNKFGYYTYNNLNGSEYFGVEIYYSIDPILNISSASKTAIGEDGSAIMKGTIVNNNSYTITWSCLADGVSFSPSTSSHNQNVTVSFSSVESAAITITATLNDAKSTYSTYVIYALEHLGTAEDPLSTSDAIVICNNVGNIKTTESYYVGGTVTNMTITENSHATGKISDGVNVLDLYRFYDVGSGNVVFTDTSKIRIGDDVVVCAPLIKFNNSTPETTGGNLVSVDSSIVLSSITLSGSITKTSYVGFYWNISELVVTATFSDSTTPDVTGAAVFTFSPATPTVVGSSISLTVSVSYTSGGVEKTDSQAYTVNVRNPDRIADSITYTSLGKSSSGYESILDKTFTSAASYNFYVGGTNTSVQMKGESNSGIIATAKGGKRLLGITVDWNSNTASGRTIDVYGKNTPYEATSDLYGTNSQKGTKLGSIVYGVSTQLTIDGDYKYIGIRGSTTAALYADEIQISWELYTAAEFESDFMQMDDYDPDLDNSAGTGACTTLYPDAKAVYQNYMSASAKEDVSDDALDRLAAWAAANGEEFNTSTGAFSSRTNVPTTVFANTEDNSSIIIIVIISVLSVAALGGYFMIRRRKDR